MKLTTKGRFAVMAMLDLAERQIAGPVTLAAISERQHISLSYLEQLFGKLRRANLVQSTRGPGGGYTLPELALNVSVADIVAAVDEPIDSTQCAGMANCRNGQVCATHELWTELNQVIVEFLSTQTLEKMLQKKRNATTLQPLIKQTLSHQSH
ncbi:MAG: Rrf2 family transcriptional regulator [Neisseriaceae bacterium]|nr:Rrf2 family transcriptional regulator [Neisseriaceae bacterium]